MDAKYEYPHDIVQYVEFLQSSLLSRVGVDPEKFATDLEYLNLHCPERRSIRQALKRMSALGQKENWNDPWSGACTTRYQDPIIIGKFLSALELVESRLNGAGGVPIIEWPLIASLPLGFINGLVCRDQSGRSGILIQEGMRFWPGTLARLCSGFFVDGERVRSPFDMEANYINRIYEKNPELSTHFLGVFYRDATMPNLMRLGQNPIIPNISQQEAKFENLFSQGFICFVVAHEYSHCINDHLNISLSNRNQFNEYSGRFTVPKRSRVEIEGALDRVGKLYPGIQVSDEQLTFFSNLQMLEHFADAQAFDFCLQYASEELGDDAWMFVMGVMSFFCYLEVTERTHRVSNQGIGWVNNPIYNGEYLCLDLLFRGEHPCNASRIKYMTDRLKLDALRETAQIWECLSRIFMVPWISNIDVLSEFYNIGELDIDEKWKIEVDCDKIFLGLSDRVPR